MNKIRSRVEGFGTVEVALAVVLVALIGIVGWLVYARHKSNDSNRTATSNTRTTQVPSPYAGWHAYTNSQVSFKYPANWEASNGPSFSQSTVADATSTAFTTSAATTAENPGLPITDYLQVSTDNVTIGCADTYCQVAATVPLNNPQLRNDVLALVNQTAGDGTKFTQWIVANSATKVGDTQINAVASGSKNMYVFGQAYYSSEKGPIAARITNVAQFQADGHFKDMVNLINSINFS